MWYAGFNLILTLNKSRLYQKSLCVLYGLSMWMLSQSSFSLCIQLFWGILLFFHGVYIIHRSIPTGQALRLIYQGDCWWCEQEGKSTARFEQASIVLHAGLFFLLKLTGSKKRLLVIFADQLSEEAFRKIKWIQLIQAAKKEE